MASTLPCIRLQTWALVRRYAISLGGSPIGSSIRLLLWPALVAGIIYWVILANIGTGPYIKPETLSSTMLFLATSFHFYHFASYLARDRDSGMKSLMRSMGLRRSSYYLAVSVCVMLTLAPTLVVLNHLSLTYIYTESQASTIEIVAFSILFAIQFNSWLFVSASVLTSSRYAPLALVALFLQALTHEGMLWVARRVSHQALVYVLFICSASPYEALGIFQSSYTTCHHCDETQVSPDELSVSLPVKLILAAMLVWSLVAHLFARWFEDVCPWQEDADIKSPLFCLEGLLFKRHKDNSEPPKDEHRSEHHFEETIDGREVGIKLERIRKTFDGNTDVVNDLSLNIYRGETTLLLGHNGAGKTSLMNIILGKLSPNSGQVTFTNTAFERKSTSIGVCPQTSVLDCDLSVLQHLELMADIKNSNMAGYQKLHHIRSTIEDVSLLAHMNKLPSELSGGMKRKLSLAMAFVAHSSILILDEPSSGLDPDSRMFIWNAIRKYRADRTVLLSTQHMEEADYLGDRIAIMSAGRIVCCGSSTFLNAAFGSGYKLRVECLQSKRSEILALVRLFFSSAKSADQEPTVIYKNSQITSDMMIELGENRSPDLDNKMIRLLENIENKAQILGIKSHGLKSSSLEDVLLSTSQYFGSEVKQLKSTSCLKLTLNTTSDRINNLTRPQFYPLGRKPTSHLYTLLAKHVSTYLRDWMSITIYRIVIPALMLLLIFYRLDKEMLHGEFYPNLLIALMVMHYIYYPTWERVSKFKAIQLASKANFLVYWLSQFIIDLPSALIGAILVNVMFRLVFTGITLAPAYQIHLILTAAMLMLQMSSAIFAYVLSTMFKEAGIGYFCMVLASTWFINRLILLLRLAIKRDFKLVNQTLLRISAAVLPTDAYQYIIYGLGAECYIKPNLPHAPHGADCVIEPVFSPILYGFVSLVGQITFYTLLLYLVEKNNLDLWYYLNLRNYRKVGKSIANNMEDIDDDVSDEMTKAMNLIGNVSIDTHSLVAADLSKSYIKGRRIIDDLSFAVNRGECFGLLGVNGAGKSTTFSMIAAEIQPDKGRIWLNGIYNTDNVDTYRSKLGYNPQSNPEMSISVYEALHLMARLRDIHELEIPTLINSALEVLDMAEHSHKTVKSLSGGTKRKLALGMAFIGNPPLLALDEPTAGVDPIARRGIWQLLKSLRSHSGVSVVISSHAMEECEAICDRISIMAGGKLRCIGSFLHLRTKFSQGCSIRVQFSASKTKSSNNSNSEIIKDLKVKLELVLGSSVRLVDTNINNATFNISDDRFKKSTLFKILKESREQHPSMSYMINDSSLEDIFIALAKEQQELELKQTL